MTDSRAATPTGGQPPLDPSELAQATIRGDRRALARALTVAERGGDPARALVAALYPRTGRSHVVGITGPPGAGKSTLVAALAQHLRRKSETVGIIAVDPSSPFTGGALLGDRIRMQALSGDSGVFIRSMAARSAHGGLARATVDAIRVLDAGGFGYVFVETVGAGQDDVEIVYAVETVVLVDVPHLGDDVQANKAGLTEIADVFVVNKADQGDADRTMAAIRQSLSLAPTPSAWKQPILKVSASQGQGIPEVVEAIDAHQTWSRGSPEDRRGESARLRREILRLAQDELIKRLMGCRGEDGIASLVDQVADRSIDPYTAVQRLIPEHWTG